MAYVYVICDPRQKGVHGFQHLPIYVGKGTYPDRAESHIKDARAMIAGKPVAGRKNKIKLRAIASIIRNGFEPVIVIAHDNMEDHEALIAEDELISKIGREIYGGPLTNKSGGKRTGLVVDNGLDRILARKRAEYLRYRAKEFYDTMSYAPSYEQTMARAMDSCGCVRIS